MKLNKDIEAKIWQVYDTWLNSYLNGDVKTYASYLDKDYHFIGSTDNEEYLNKKNSTHFFKKTADQLAGKCDLRNETRIIEKFEALVFITHLFDAWFLNKKDWVYYGRFRFTSTLKENTDGWRFIYQHFSTTDSKTEEDETIGFDKVNAENQELREAIKRRTFELEEKNRALEIEAALECVRSRSIAMHHSEELQEVITTVLQQLNGLNLPIDSALVSMPLEEEKALVNWIATIDFEYSEGFKTPFDCSSLISNELENAVRKGNTVYTKQYSKEEKDIFYNELFECSDFRNIPQERKDFLLSGGAFGMSGAVCKNSGIITLNYSGQTLNQEEINVLQRFSLVFEQAYTRFLDLQKAEAQTREAQIEAALERVRSRSMAMHKSDEMLEIIEIVAKQLLQLNLKFDTVSFGKDNQEGDFKFWIASKGQPKPILIQVPFYNCSILNTVQEAQKKEISFLQNVFNAKENKEWSQHLIKYSDLKYLPEEVKDFILNAPGFARSSFLLKSVNLYVGNYRAAPFTKEENAIFSRFAHVFEQAYTRFLDLQKVEKQAREAQIEAALERVRAKAMAMHSSKDISGATVVVFNELRKLGIECERCGIIILNDTPIMEVWSTPLSPENNEVIEVVTGNLNTNSHPLLQGVYQSWANNEHYYSYELKGKEVKKYYDLLEKAPDYRFPKISNYPERQIINTFHFKEGGVFVYHTEILSDDTKQILNRFTNVFSLTYRRYLDIIRAEAQAKEAIKQASLDRVRGEIASMRSTEDLQRITPLVFNELKTLGVPFIRCGVFIIDQNKKNIKAYLSAPDGHSLGVLNLAFGANKLTTDSVAHWQKNKVYHQHWNKTEFIDWTKSMMKLGQVQNQKTYQGAALPPESLDLHFIPFTQGMLYVGNVEQLTHEEIDLVKSLAKAFAMAYSRYEDFNHLEKAKNKIEHTLVELKAAQKQLIQSEKMASLGELTAGIAHEIQNPLNFVNNFSEVSNEMVDEIQEKRTKKKEERDEELVGEILGDIKQNLEKITHHGKRASGIVKGMLQHSRSNSGTKEPTDINALADEYLRLSYHGLRAKDKSFNADFTTNFDNKIPKIEVVPQDMGRVFLNLINNAFYACTERLSAEQAGSRSAANQKTKKHYKPTVSVSTKLEGKHVVIQIEDNGIGMSKEIKDKIFQPFFTTKPTGKGTGLGLSLSYDIIKAHGGELKVKSKMGKGTEFIIALPINNQ